MMWKVECRLVSWMLQLCSSWQYVHIVSTGGRGERGEGGRGGGGGEVEWVCGGEGGQKRGCGPLGSSVVVGCGCSGHGHSRNVYDHN